MDTPGKNGRSFYLKLDKHSFEVNDVVEGPYSPVRLKVIKTYPFNWWRKLLFILGFPYKSMDLVKVKPYEEKIPVDIGLLRDCWSEACGSGYNNYPSIAKMQADFEKWMDERNINWKNTKDGNNTNNNSASES